MERRWFKSGPRSCEGGQRGGGLRAAVSRIRMLRTPYNGHSNRVETGRAVVTHTCTRRRGVKLSVRVSTGWAFPADGTVLPGRSGRRLEFRSASRTMLRQSRDRVAPIIGPCHAQRNRLRYRSNSYLTAPLVQQREKRGSRPSLCSRNVLSIFCGWIEENACVVDERALLCRCLQRAIQRGSTVERAKESERGAVDK